MKAQHTLKYWARNLLTNALPSGIYGRLDQLRRWRHYRKARIVFVHVPKAAGSSVATILYGRRLGHHPAIALMSEDPEGWAELDRFAIVREPVSRFLSAFSYVMGAGTREGAVRWRPEYEQLSFRDANVFVSDYLAQGAIFEKDIVFWPQSHFVCDASSRPLSGLQVFTTNRFSAVNHYLAGRGYAAPQRLNRRPTTVDLNMVLNPDTHALLKAIYASDFELFQSLEAK